MEIIYREEAYKIIGACFEVYNELGSGFLEGVYQEALEIELRARGIPFLAKPKLRVSYKGSELQQWYEPDLVVESKIIVELKAVKAIGDAFRAQVFNYLKATSFRLGLLVNFGSPGELAYERIVR